MISVCEHSHFQGNCVTLPVGRYDVDDLSNNGMQNDDISSIAVPRGYFVTVFSDARFSGQNVTFYTDTHHVDEKWSYNISSVKVGINNCSPKPAYKPPENCYCTNLTSSNDTKTKLIAPINDGLNNMTNTGPNMTFSLCPGTYSWPIDSGVFLHRTDTNANVTLTLDCCGDAGSCIFDGEGKTYNQSLFTFETPVVLTMAALTFQNFNHSGGPNNNGAIIRTTSFTDVNLHYLNINHITSQGNGGAFSFENPTIANITSSNFTSNSAGSDGGVFYYFSTSLMAIWGNTFSNNKANRGGALHSIYSYTHAECNRFENNTASSNVAVFLDSSTMDLNGDEFTTNVASFQDGSDAYLQNSGLCRQTTKNTWPTSLTGLSSDSTSLFVPQCNGLDWKIGFPGGDSLEKATQPYRGVFCSSKPSYNPPLFCERACIRLSSASDTRTQVIDLVNNGLNNLNYKNPSTTINLCRGTYAWPTDAGVFIYRKDTGAKLTLTINCCADADSCVFDGEGQKYKQPLFQFESPILFMMRGITFQNFNYAGEDAAIITTRAFTVVDLHFLKISNVASEGEWSSGAIKFDAPTMANITNSQFINNVAGWGGGAITYNATAGMNLWGNTFLNNTAKNKGGALYSFWSYTRSECNTFHNNSVIASGKGGGVYLEESTLELSGDDFDWNFASPNNGLDIYLESSGLCKESSTLSTNLSESGVSMDSASLFIDFCDGSMWEKCRRSR